MSETEPLKPDPATTDQNGQPSPVGPSPLGASPLDTGPLDTGAADSADDPSWGQQQDTPERSETGQSNRTTEAGTKVESASPELERFTGSPTGMRREGERGELLIDAMAGRCSPYGFGHEPSIEAIRQAASRYLGDAASFTRSYIRDEDLRSRFERLLDDTGMSVPQSVTVCASADLAIDFALQRARQTQNRFRTLAIVGSDHGRTGMCRAASGDLTLRDRLGPLMAGFTHVPPDDLDAVAEAIDEQTGCILISPIDFARAARPIDADYLTGLRELCDQVGLLLAIDETQVPVGSCGTLFGHTSIAPVTADLLMLSAGLFSGLPGGLVLTNLQLEDGHESSLEGPSPILSALAHQTLDAAAAPERLEVARESGNRFAVAVAEVVRRFEFVRDVHACGMTVGIELDVESNLLVRTASEKGLRIESAGESAVVLQPPIVAVEQDQRMLLERLIAALGSVETVTSVVEA